MCFNLTLFLPLLGTPVYLLDGLERPLVSDQDPWLPVRFWADRLTFLICKASMLPLWMAMV